jgi:Uma2 family endonuclease
MSPSVNHSYVQATLISALLSLKQYSVFSELSIEIEGKEYVPDICVYAKREIDFLHDTLRMTEMPLLAIEILSPSQAVQELVDKIDIYLNAKIQSCWLVVPTLRSITVCNSLKKFESYSKDQIVDEKLNISLEWQEIFSL